MIIITPGPDGIWSPMRTSGWPEIVIPLEPPGPIGSGYGAPETELIIWQIEPLVASGCPFAVTFVCSTVVMTPLSGGPAAPGVRTTEQPMLTGAPGILTPS